MNFPAKALLPGILLSLSFAASAGEYRFLWEGKEFEPQVLAVCGEPGHPAPGDVACIQSYPYVLGPPGTYAFRADGSTRLLCRLPGHPEETCVGVKVVDPDDEEKQPDPLSGMSKEQKAMLGSVVLHARPAKWDQALRDIPWDRAMLEVDDEIAEPSEKTVLPELPSGVTYLFLRFHSSLGINDFRSLRKLNALQAVGIRVYSDFDLGVLEQSTGLKWFSCDYGPCSNFGVIRRWANLRSLRLAWSHALDDISFVTATPELRELDLSGSRVSNLDPVAGLLHLTTLRATATAVVKLPDDPRLPALRQLFLLATEVPAPEVERLRAALPQCRVLESRHAALADAVSGCDRLRVRSGGTCHRQVAKEKTLLEVRDAAEICRFVAMLTFDNDDTSAGACLCCGDPTFEFYQGEKLLAMIGFHHDVSLRWPGGEWPGDAKLTLAAQESVCKYLGDHGLPEMLKASEQARRAQIAMARRHEACLKIASEEQLRHWSKAVAKDATDNLEQELERAWPDPAERAARLLALYGVDPHATWLWSVDFDHALRDFFLDVVTPQQLRDLAARPDCSPQVLQGIARRVFSDHLNPNPASEFPDEVLARLAAWGFGHPRDQNREDTELALAELAQPRADALLLQQLRHPANVRPLPDADRNEPGGSYHLKPWKFNPPAKLTDRGRVAFLLGERHVLDAIPDLERLSKEGTNDDRAACTAALRQLRRPASGSVPTF